MDRNIKALDKNTLGLATRRLVYDKATDDYGIVTRVQGDTYLMLSISTGLLNKHTLGSGEKVINFNYP